MSRIVSPNPLVITVTVNEITNEIQAVANKPIPHIAAVGILLTAAQGFIADGMKQAAKAPGLFPGNLPSNPPNENPGGTDGQTKN